MPGKEEHGHGDRPSPGRVNHLVSDWSELLQICGHLFSPDIPAEPLVVMFHNGPLLLRFVDRDGRSLCIGSLRRHAASSQGLVQLKGIGMEARAFLIAVLDQSRSPCPVLRNVMGDVLR